MEPNNSEKWVLRIAAIAGLVLFGAFFAFTYSMPQWVERIGTEFIAGKVAEKVDGTIDAVRPPRRAGALARVAADFYAKNEQRIQQLKSATKLRAREAMAAALAQVRDPECECRRAAVQALDLLRIQQLIRDNERLASLIHGTYMRVKNDLTREIRIFTATNAVCFLLLIVVSFGKPAAASHLFFPGVLLMMSTLFSAWLYVFSQDWLLTIIHGSYLGYAYAAYLGIVFLFVCDIALNRGRITTRIVNGAAGSIGSVFTVSPC